MYGASGHPARHRRRRSWWPSGLAALVVFVIMGGGGYALLARHPSAARPPGSGVAGGLPTGSAQPSGEEPVVASAPKTSSGA